MIGIDIDLYYVYLGLSLPSSADRFRKREKKGRTFIRQIYFTGILSQCYVGLWCEQNHSSSSYFCVCRTLS